MNSNILVAFLLTISCALISSVAAQQKTKAGGEGYELSRGPDDVMFCVLSNEELAKCQAFAEATARDHLRNEKTFGSYYISMHHVQYADSGKLFYEIITKFYYFMFLFNHLINIKL